MREHNCANDLKTSVGRLAENVFVAPHCEIHSFDSAFAPDLLSQWFTDDQIKSGKVKTHQMFISSKDDLSANPPHRSVPSIMAELGHTHVDILKVRCTGALPCDQINCCIFYFYLSRSSYSIDGY